MKLSDSKLLIRDYKTIKEMLRKTYIFGCFHRNNYINDGIGGRTYDDNARRIKAYLPDDFLDYKYIGKNKTLHCKYDILNGSDNYLADTYTNKSFTMLDIMSYFFILQILGDDKKLTLLEILEEIPINEEIEFTESNLRTKIDELIDVGLINKEIVNNKAYYKVIRDVWKEFSNEELREIYLYIEFLTNVLPIEMPYYLLKKRLKMYLITKRKINVDDDRIILFKHNHLFNVIDNEILLEVLKSIYSKSYIKIVNYYNEEFQTIPIKVIHDSVSGRQYLLAYDEKEKMSRAIRIDRIVEIKIENRVDNELYELALQQLSVVDQCWCVSGLDKDITKVEIEFIFDEDSESYIKKRIIKEGKWGELNKISYGKYSYVIYVKDPNEMKPWIRSFGERAKVISSGDFKLKEDISKEWEEALINYENI